MRTRPATSITCRTRRGRARWKSRSRTRLASAAPTAPSRSSACRKPPMVLRATHAGPADLFALHRLAPDDYPFLLQSVAGHPVSGRYDILFAFPGAVLRGQGREFFDALSAAAQVERADSADDLPFCGGWFLLIGYEAAGHIEPRLRLPESPFALPELLAIRCPAAVIRDHARNETHLLA